MAGEAAPRRSRGLLAIGIGLFLVVGAGGTFAYDRLAARHFELASAVGVRVTCTAHPLAGPSFYVEGERADGTAWRAPLPRGATNAALLPDRVLLMLDDGGCVDPEVEPEWLEPEPPTEDRAAPLPALRAEEVSRLLRDDPTAVAGSIPPVPGAGLCVVDPSGQLEWCRDTETTARLYILHETTLIEVLDLSPRVLVAFDMLDGRQRWRTEVPSEPSAVWMLPRGDGVAVRAGEVLFELDVETGALDRVTPEGASICTEGELLVSMSSGTLSATSSAGELREVARPGAGELADCFALFGTDHVAAVVRAAADPVGEASEPAAFDGTTLPLTTGVGIYVLAADATLVSSYALPWAADIDHRSGFSATITGTESIALGVSPEGTIRLAPP